MSERPKHHVEEMKAKDLAQAGRLESQRFTQRDDRLPHESQFEREWREHEEVMAIKAKLENN